MYEVQGMTCGHCVAQVDRAARLAAPAAEIAVDLSRGTLSVRGNHDKDRLIAAVVAAGYPIAEM